MSYQLPAVSPPYVIIGSDYSAQEPRITAFISQDPEMIKAFKEGRDVYASIASIAFNVPYEKCLEFHPETHEYQPDGKARRGEAKTILLGICYGRSVKTIGDQLYGSRDDMTDEQKTAGAQKVYDSVLKAFPGLRDAMMEAQAQARHFGYVTTILGRRRHIPDMQLPPFEFVPMHGYVNPDVDPLDPSTFDNKDAIPERIIKSLIKEFAGFKYYGQIVKRTKQLAEEKIKVINNTQKITEASRECLNCVDDQTEILTVHGWKKHYEVFAGDEILSYNLDTQTITRDSINDVLRYHQDVEVVEFNSPSLNAVSTLNHRWVVCESDGQPLIKTTKEIYDEHESHYNILCASENNFEDNSDASDDLLKQFGQILLADNPLSQLQTVDDNLSVSTMMSPEFILSLSKRQAQVVLQSMAEDIAGECILPDPLLKVTCSNSACCELLQMLAFVAGYATISDRKTTLPDAHSYYDLTLLRSKTVPVCSDCISTKHVDFVWCVNTNNGTWIARRHGKVFITGNSRIQGSAAEQTKLALLLISNNDEWKRLGARVICPVHDEILAEVPIQNAARGGQLLSELMCKAAEFLPFDSKCDVETSFRWYGLSYPCPYPKPESIDDLSRLSVDEIKWIQYNLFEHEYTLPIYKDENGEKPKGDAAKGVNGVISEELHEAIRSYVRKYGITKAQFIQHIDTNTVKGRSPLPSEMNYK